MTWANAARRDGNHAEEDKALAIWELGLRTKDPTKCRQGLLKYTLTRPRNLVVFTLLLLGLTAALVSVFRKKPQ